MKKFVLILGFLIFFINQPVLAAQNWVNDLRRLYLSGNAIIYGINIRTFSAVDKNGDGIINIQAGEKRGNFLSAIKKLDDIAAQNINTINLLPVLPVGKTKAIGTAGSLYAPTAFDRINPQLKAPDSKYSVSEEMEIFINACHKRGLRVIVDLPCCASYDLYLAKPSLFLKDSSNNPIVLSDWTDVRMLDSGSETAINQEVYKLYSDFLKMLLNLGVDGVKVNAPETKPYLFWNKLITQTRNIDPQFLFIAEAAKTNDIKDKNINLISTSKLLEAGFDGCYGSFDKFADITTSSQLADLINKDLAVTSKYKDKKTLANFVTHDQMSPILKNGEKLSSMIIWLQATLPFNTYYIDGFSTGDTYLYPKANKKADISYTDDEYYFVHRGKLDIFNFSRALDGNNSNITDDFVNANRVKDIFKNYNQDSSVKILKADNGHVFAYQRIFDKSSVIVIGNLNFTNSEKAEIRFKSVSNEENLIPLKFEATPKLVKNKISIELSPGEIFVALLTEPKLK